MCRQAKIGENDEGQLAGELDPKPRLIPVTERFMSTLENNREAQAIFEKLPSSHKKEILTYLSWSKKPVTLERNIQKTISYLLRQGTRPEEKK